MTSESKELKSIKQKKAKVKKVEEIKGKPSLTGKNVSVDAEVFEDMKILATQRIIERNSVEKLEKELKEARNESKVASKESRKDKLTIKERDKEISKLKSTSTVLKVTSENSKLKEELEVKDKELTYLRKFKEEITKIFKLKEVKEFFMKLGLFEKIQELIQEKLTVKNREQKQDSR